MSYEHAHAWRLRELIDRCHYTQKIDDCDECGESRLTYEFRDFTDGTKVAFADPKCESCRSLVRQAGQAERWTETL